MKFKVGDKVEVVKSLMNGYEMHVGHVGTITTVSPIGNSKYPYMISGINDLGWNNEELQLIKEKNMYEEGQILVNVSGYECEILAVCGRGILLSGWSEPNETGRWYTAEEIETTSWKLKDPTTPETIELTLEEVAEKFGHAVDKIRIKD